MKARGKVGLKSILEPLVKEVEMKMAHVSTEEIKKSLSDQIRKTKVNDKDKLKLLQDISRQQNGLALVKFLYNAILKYEGFGVVKTNHVTAKPEPEEQEQEEFQEAA